MLFIALLKYLREVEEIVGWFPIRLPQSKPISQDMELENSTGAAVGNDVLLKPRIALQHSICMLRWVFMVMRVCVLCQEQRGVEDIVDAIFLGEF